MHKHLPHTIFLLLAFNFQLLAFSLKAQTVFIPPGGNVFSHPTDSVGIFGNVINEGNFGTKSGSVIDFSGARWQNTPLSLLPGASTGSAPGGLFRFIGKQKQSLAAGYNLNGKTGPSFPNLSIENPAGVWLQDLNDLHIRGNLHFDNGYLYLNGWNTLVNDSITGYSEKGFVVTGEGIGGGSLYRKPPSSAGRLVVFPVGTDADSYSPLGIKASQPFSGIVGATVFEHVFQHAINGNVIDSDYVKKTWQVKSVQGKEQTKVLLQHNAADEGVRFTPYRDSSYISLYNLSNGLWDMDPLPHSVVNPGTLTTGKLRNNTFLNNRIFPNGLPAENTDSISWFSISAKSNRTTCPLVDFKLWVAQRYNGRWIQLFWRTLHEMNIVNYQVQRRRDTSSVFKTITIVNSKGVNGFSNHLLYYYFADDDTYDGWTYYRLKMTSASGCVVYTDIQAVSWDIDIKVWPNPSPGETHVRITGIKHPIIMQLVDTWGQILQQYNIDHDGTFDIRYLSDAVYFLVFRDPKNNYRKITTIKLVVQQNK